MKDLFEQAFLQVNIGILTIDKNYNIILANDFVVDYTQKSKEDIINKNIFDIYPQLPRQWFERRINNIVLLKNSSFVSWEQRPSLFKFSSSRPITGYNNIMFQNCSMYPIEDDNGEVSHICITINDVTSTAISQLKVKKALERISEEKRTQQKLIGKLEEAKDQLVQSEKMASIGQLAAGVAHEINNPVGFIKSNFSSLKRYGNDLQAVIEKYNGIIKELEKTQTQSEIEQINEEFDIDFITEDIQNLLSESFEGITRIEDIVNSLKDYSRNDTRWEQADINSHIENTLKIVSHELKYVASIEKDYGVLPLVECLPMQIGQVIMNLLVNAGQALTEDGKIVIKTMAQDDKVFITVSDNGKGIEKEHLAKIFDPFFTTKPVGKGTGLGLSLSYNIIQKHNGEMSVESEINKGTDFIIQLPIQQTTVAPAIE